jgi:Family of unknown function (DUF5652)
MTDVSFLQMYNQWMYLFVILLIWETVWKGIALWKAAKETQLYWFIAILILNTVGILPILYIFVFKKGKKGF